MLFSLGARNIWNRVQIIIYNNFYTLLTINFWKKADINYTSLNQINRLFKLKYGYFALYLERISAFKTWLKNPKNRKLKLCLLFGLNVFFNVLSLIRINYQCSKLNTYLVTIFLSDWGYCVYIEIQLRLSPAPTFRALKKYERSDITFSYAHLWI